MARAQGARSELALAFETVYGSSPASGYKRMPFASTTLGMEQPLLASELLGYGRDPQAPIKDAISVDGDVVVPMDVEALGYWLKGAFGAPTTTGTTPKTHTFNSGGWSLPSMSIERATPEVPLYAMYAGCMVDRLNWTMQRSGLLTMTVGLIAQGEARATATAAGTPADITLARFGTFHGAIKRNGTSLGNIVSAEITYANNLDRIETIRADGKIDGADPSMAALSGSLTARFADTTLIDQAASGASCELEFSYVIDANNSFKMTAHAVYLPSPRVQVEGPQGVQVTFDWQAAKATSPARMCTAVLVNSVATY